MTIATISKKGIDEGNIIMLTNPEAQILFAALEEYAKTNKRKKKVQEMFKAFSIDLSCF